MRPGPGQLAALRAELAQLLLRDDPETLAPYGHDESGAADCAPDLLVLARSTAEVQATLRACSAHRVPVTPVGARSGKSGGSLPLYGGVALSLEKMNRILALNREDLTAVVEPGVVTGALMQAAEAEGLFYPPDPSSLDYCTLGGNIAENAGGPRALKYGVTRDYVLGLQWVLPGGELLEIGRSCIKGVAGYDLTGLLVGSEGTLGVATAIILRLIPLPPRVMTALVVFNSTLDAARAVSAVLAAGLLPRALELMDEVCLRAVHGKGFDFPAAAGAVLIVEVDGATDESLLHEMNRMGEIFERGEALETVVAHSASQRARLWAARRMASSCLRALKPHKLSEDIVVPRSSVPEAIARFKALGAELGLTVATYGHAGDGNLHANILFDGPQQQPKVDAALAEMIRTTLELGGTITGEHGVGLTKREFLPLEQSPLLIDLQKRLKAQFDPLGICNPGKIFKPAD